MADQPKTFPAFLSPFLETLSTSIHTAPGQVIGPIEEPAHALMAALLIRSFAEKSPSRRLWFEINNPRWRNQLDAELSALPIPQPHFLPAPELQSDASTAALGEENDWQLALHQIAGDSAFRPVLLSPSAWNLSLIHI